MASSATVMFVAGPEAALEQAVYAGAQDGTLHGAADLDALTQKIFARYSISCWMVRPSANSRWSIAVGTSQTNLTTRRRSSKIRVSQTS